MASPSRPPTPEYLAENTSHMLVTVSIAFIVIDTFFVGLRFVSRRYEPAKVGANDVFLVIGWLNCLAQCADGIVSAHLGSGLHLERIALETPQMIPHWGKNNLFAYPILYIWAITWTKISILFLYLRIFSDKFSRAFCWILIGILAINPVINTFINIFQCNPRHAAWTPALTADHCQNIQAHLAFASLINIISDVGMLVIPLPVIKRLQVPRHIKYGIAGTFLLGSLGLFSAVYRFAVFLVIDYAIDPTWYAVPLLNWTIVEAGVYLISACLISSKPIFVKIINSQRVSTIYTWALGTLSSTRKKTDGQSNGSVSKPLPFGRNREGNGFRHIRGNSFDALATPVESYSLESNGPGKIYVKRESEDFSSGKGVYAGR